MPNTDVIRSAIIGPIEYICRPKEKPAELLACYPLNGSLADISNYGCGDVYTSQSTTYDTTSTPPSLQSSTATTKWNFYPTNFNLAQPWSFEFWIDGAKNTTVSLGLDFKIRAMSGDYAAYVGFEIWSGTSRLARSNAMYLNVATPSWEHHAFAYNGTTLYYYFNGVAKYSYTTALSGNQELCTINESDTSYTKAIANVRFVQKFIGTTSQYPVTATSFTGYEEL